MRDEAPNHVMSMKASYMYNPIVFSSFSFHKIVCDWHWAGV